LAVDLAVDRTVVRGPSIPRWTPWRAVHDQASASRTGASMRSHVFSVPILAIAGCAGATTTGARAHDAMVAQLRALEHDRPPATSAEPALGGATLGRAALVAAVLAANPELEAALEAWRAATAGYAPAVAFSDPMVTYEVAPLSISGDVAFGERIAL